MSEKITAETFVPDYMEDVFQTFTMTGENTHVNPKLCLSEESAEQMAEILADLDPRVVLADPFAVAGAVLFNKLVPWLVFPSGAAANCGGEANFWSMQPTNGKGAEAACRKDIEGIERQFEAEGNTQYPAQLKNL